MQTKYIKIIIYRNGLRNESKKNVVNLDITELNIGIH